MADIFISYAREDREWVSRLAAIFVSEGYTVWWDFDLLVGKRYRETIEAELQECKATVVVWSEHSTKSDFVRDEAEEGQQRNVLLPVLKTPIRPPAGFRQLQTADLSNWAGELNHPEFRRMMKGVAYLVGREPKSEQHGAAAPVAPATPAAATPVESHSLPVETHLAPVEAHAAPAEASVTPPPHAEAQSVAPPPHPAETPKPSAFAAAPVHKPVVTPSAPSPSSNLRWIVIGVGVVGVILLLYGLRALIGSGPNIPAAPAANAPPAAATPAPAPMQPASPAPPHQGSSAATPAPAAPAAPSSSGDEGQQGQRGGTGTSRPSDTAPSGNAGDTTGDTEGSQRRH
jgi:hypothetical protein